MKTPGAARKAKQEHMAEQHRLLRVPLERAVRDVHVDETEEWASVFTDYLISVFMLHRHKYAMLSKKCEELSARSDPNPQLTLQASIMQTGAKMELAALENYLALRYDSAAIQSLYGLTDLVLEQLDPDAMLPDDILVGSLQE